MSMTIVDLVLEINYLQFTFRVVFYFMVSMIIFRLNIKKKNCVANCQIHNC